MLRFVQLDRSLETMKRVYLVSPSQTNSMLENNSINELVSFWLLVYSSGVIKMKETINIQTFAEYLYLSNVHTIILKQQESTPKSVTFTSGVCQNDQNKQLNSPS